MNCKKNSLAGFFWGTPAEVASRVEASGSSFRLIHPAGVLPPAEASFAVPAHARPIRRGDRTVAHAWETADAEFLFMAGVQAPDLTAARSAQAAAVFPEMERILAAEGMTFAHVVRTWLYIDRVCEWYGAFNAARSAFYETRRVFETFLPASTGIGSANLEGAALVAGALAMKPKRAGVRAEIVESPLQAPAMAYKSSFSRAAEIITPAARQLFISGTASIKPNSSEVAFVGDVVKQIDLTMEVVQAILASRGYDWHEVSRAIVYLKDPSFRAPWRAWLAAHGLPETFAAETVCDVCRAEWLFEIEADAVKGARFI